MDFEWFKVYLRRWNSNRWRFNVIMFYCWRITKEKTSWSLVYIWLCISFLFFNSLHLEQYGKFLPQFLPSSIDEPILPCWYEKVPKSTASLFLYLFSDPQSKLRLNRNLNLENWNILYISVLHTTTHTFPLN